MKHVRALTYATGALLVVLASTFGACSKGDGLLDPSPVEIPVATAAPVAAPTSTPAATEGGSGGIQVQNLESNFNPDRCTELNLPEYAGVLELFSKNQVMNNTDVDHHVYDSCALFSTPIQTCAAHAENPASQSDLERFADAPDIPKGQTATWTHTLPLAEIFGSDNPDDWCGSKQYDCEAKNGTQSAHLFGKVIKTGRNCANCEDANVRFDVRVLDESTGKVKISVRWRENHQGTVYKGKLSIDGGPYERIQSPYEVTRDFGGNSGGHTIDFKIVVGTEDLANCAYQEKVRFEHQDPPDCDDLSVQLRKSQGESVTAASVSAATSGPQYCFSGSWVQPPSNGNLDFGDGSASQVVPTPFGSACHTYPAPTLEEQTFTATLMVIRDQLECPATETVKIPPRDKTCRDYEDERPTITGDVATTQDATTLTMTQGTVGPSGGTFSPSLPQTVSRPAAGNPPGSVSSTYTLFYGPPELECSVDKTFTKPVPPKDPPCQDPYYWNQSTSHNSNWVKGNVHVRGDGDWVLKLYAASHFWEYPNDPDYTKDTDSKSITCRGEGELKVEYNWKNHDSRYWWVALYRDGSRVWLSSRIDKH